MEEKNYKKKLKDIIFWKSNPDDKNNIKYSLFSLLIWILFILTIFSLIGGIIK